MLLSLVLAYIERCSQGECHRDIIMELTAAREKIEKLEAQLETSGEPSMALRRLLHDEIARSLSLKKEVDRLNAVIELLSKNNHP